MKRNVSLDERTEVILAGRRDHGLNLGEDVRRLPEPPHR